MTKLIVLAMVALLSTSVMAGRVSYKTVYPLVSLGNGYFGSADNVCIEGDNVLHKTKETWTKCVNWEQYGSNQESRCTKYAELNLIGPVVSYAKRCAEWKEYGSNKDSRCIRYTTYKKDHSLPKVVTTYKITETRNDERSEVYSTTKFTIPACN